jgi:NAD(P)-dependent dehydrogenase (short-subunit alcohol dehydrogenase family)
LGSLKSIKECADKLKTKCSRIDILINNAGLGGVPYIKTEDGFETQFGVNHLGHFYLTNLLLDLVKSSAPSRIINVTSMAHKGVKMNWDDLQSEKSYASFFAYRQSKLANCLFTFELSKRLKGN